MEIKKRRRAYAPKTISIKSRGYKPKVISEYTLADAFAAMGQGNSRLEKAVDGAARSMGIFFAAYQYYVPLTTLESTIIDFVLWNPKPIAIFADGIQHELRPDTAEQDLIRRGELEAMGWSIVAIRETDFLIDPIGQVSRILWV